MWKSVFLAVGLTMAALWYDAAPPPPPNVSAPHANGSQAAALSLTSNHRDLGRTSEGNLWEAAFSVRNTGGRRLVINELDSTCDCDERSVRTYLVAPGETVDLIVTLDARWGNGEVQNVASFTTNDPQRPRLDLTLRALVDAPAVGDSEQGEDCHQVREWIER